MKINNRWSKFSRSEKIYIPTMEKNQIIDTNSKICSMGSCFADNVSWFLMKNKFDIGDFDILKEEKLILFPWGNFFNIPNLKEILFHTLGEKTIDINENAFIKTPLNHGGNSYLSDHSYNDKDEYKLINLFFKTRSPSKDIENAIKVTNKKINIYKKHILESNIFIITLGLIETWVDKISNNTWLSFHGDPIKKTSIDSKSSFKIIEHEENKKLLGDIISLLLGINRNNRIIITVSPVPLTFTFSNTDVVTANRYSKSVLRSIINDFIDNKKVFYFPAFEIVTDCVGFPNSFDENKRQIKLSVFDDYIAPLFLENFVK